ncbi:MAG: hypothetical protein AB2L14_10845 [Candidatus Xenobiia bacterium LiM19]
MTAPINYHDTLIIELSGEEMGVVKDALDRARKESGLRDRKSLLLFIVKSFLDGTVTSGRETRKPENSDKSSDGNDKAPGGRIRRVVKKKSSPGVMRCERFCKARSFEIGTALRRFLLFGKCPETRTELRYR